MNRTAWIARWSWFAGVFFGAIGTAGSERYAWPFWVTLVVTLVVCWVAMRVIRRVSEDRGREEKRTRT